MADWLAWVGCRTTRERNARGEGISLFHISASGAWTLVDVVRGLDNPSWITLDARRGVLYVAHGDREIVSAFRIARADGRLTALGAVSCEGRNPVHLALSPDGRFLVVTNHVATDAYRSGLVAIALADDGTLGAISDRLPFDGPLGPHRLEQPFAKPHQAVFVPSGKWLVVPDKGTNEIVVTALDANGRFQSPIAPKVRLRETAGPRHIAFDDQGFLFVINELDSTVTACAFDDDSGAIQPVRNFLSVPPTCVGDSRGAEIAMGPNGRVLYTSNRGDDTVGAFAVAPDTGALAPLGWVQAGRTPRFFCVSPDGDALFVAGEESDEILRVSIGADGALGKPVRVASVGSPTVIAMMPRV